MIVSLLVLVVLSGLGAIIFTTATSNLENSGRDRIAGGAMGTAEAGIAEALAYMRVHGTGLLTCDAPSTSSTLCSNDWGYNYPTAGAGGHRINLPGGRIYKVWIQRIRAFTPGASPPEGKYKIHSVGTQGVGPGARTITTEVTVKPHNYPLAVFGKDFVRNGGNTQMERISLFARGCVGKRDRLLFDESQNDLAYPSLVPGAHSTLWISNSQVGSAADADCSATERQNIHRSTTSNPAGPGPCSWSNDNKYNYKFDQDAQGGSLTGTACDPINNLNRGLPTPPGSFFDENALRSYGYSEPRGLPADQYAALAQQAQTQGNFYDCVSVPRSSGCNSSGDLTGFSAISGSTLPNAVVYVKLAPAKTFTISPSLITGYGESTCGQRSVVLVVEGGDLHVNNTVDMVGATFVPDGRAFVNGAANIIGTLFAKSVFLNGTGAKFALKSCFFQNMPGLQIVSPSNFAEVDR